MFSFLNAALLPGLALISLPIIIYLLQKHKVKEMEWAAMEFLQEIIEEQQRKIQIEDLLLLLLRVLMFICLALALARPALNTKSGVSWLGSSGDAIIVLDDTYSMATRRGAQDRFETAKERALSIIDTLPANYGISLILGSENSDVIVGSFSSDHELLKTTITELKPGFMAGNSKRMISNTISVIDKSKPAAKTTFIISDFQSSDWAEPTESLKAELSKLEEKSQIIFIPVSDPVAENISVADLSLAQGAVRSGQKGFFIGSLQNHGATAIKDAAIDLIIDGQTAESSTVSIAANQSAKVYMSYTVDDPGAHRAVLQIAQDSNPADNKAYLAFNAFDQLKILSITDQSPIAGEAKATDFIELALNPYEERSKDPRALYLFEHIGMQDLVTHSLSVYELVVISDVVGLSSGEVNVLETYVKEGGGVIFFMGKTTNADVFNSNLYRKGEGLFAWPLATELVRHSDKGKDLPLMIELSNKEHPIWQNIVDGKVNYMAAVNIYRTFGFQVGDEKRAIPLAQVKDRENNKLASIVDFKFGRGHAIVVGTSADLSWNNFAARPAFLAFIHQTTKYLQKDETKQRSNITGESLELPVNWQRSRANYELTNPMQEKRTVSVLKDAGDEYKIDIGTLSTPGFYTLVNTEDATDKRLFSVNLNHRESRINALGVEQLKGLYEASNITVDSSSDLSVAAKGVKATPNLALWLLTLAMLFWIAENLLAHKIARRAL